ncbi:hypothetical protein [Ensifer soli]|uniref:hypothetical protein n=1 Tax=Ciceribacter sp. sgz301302 TaxID=3342379 RepID=UPI0035B822B8
MSVIALHVSEHGVSMACDGVSYRSDGKISGFVSKMYPLVHLNAVMGNTGVGGICAAIIHLMGDHVRDFDHLVEVIPELFKFAYNKIVETHVPNVDDLPPSCVVIAGWSSLRNSYSAYRVMSYAKQTKDSTSGKNIELKPWKVHEIKEFWASFEVPEDKMRSFLVIDSGATDAISYCARYVCAARACSGTKDPDAKGMNFNAGGFLQVLTLYEDDIRTTIAHRWVTDAVGKAIDPEQGERMPSSLM